MEVKKYFEKFVLLSLLVSKFLLEIALFAVLFLMRSLLKKIENRANSKRSFDIIPAEKLLGKKPRLCCGRQLSRSASFVLLHESRHVSWKVWRANLTRTDRYCSEPMRPLDRAVKDVFICRSLDCSISSHCSFAVPFSHPGTR